MCILSNHLDLWLLGEETKVYKLKRALYGLKQALELGTAELRPIFSIVAL